MQGDMMQFVWKDLSLWGLLTLSRLRSSRRRWTLEAAWYEQIRRLAWHTVGVIGRASLLRWSGERPGLKMSETSGKHLWQKLIRSVRCGGLLEEWFCRRSRTTQTCALGTGKEAAQCDWMHRKDHPPDLYVPVDEVTCFTWRCCQSFPTRGLC